MPPTLLTTVAHLARCLLWHPGPAAPAAHLASFFDSPLSQTLFCFSYPSHIPLCRSFRVPFELRKFCTCQSHFFHVTFSPQAPFPDSRLPSFSNTVCPSHFTRLTHPHNCASRPHKDTSSAGKWYPTQEKVSPSSSFLRTTLTVLSVQSSRGHSCHHPVNLHSIVSSSGILGLWRGTSAMLIRYINLPGLCAYVGL
jgi:hypothetical protein